MINQLIVGCGHAVMAEALLLAEAAGIDAARIPECLAGGHADGTLLQKLYPRMVARDFAPQGYARQLLKDLEMVNEFAGALKAPVPMTGEALVALPHADSPRARRARHGGGVQALRTRRGPLTDRATLHRRGRMTPDQPRRQRDETQGFAALLSTTAALVALAAGGIAGAQAQVKLRYAHVGVANAPQTLYADEVAKLVKERTNGRVEIQVFPNSQLGGVGEMVDGVKSGAIAMGHHDFASLGKIVLDDRGVQHAVRLSRRRARLRATDARTSPALQEINQQLVDKGNMRIVGSFFQGTRAAHVEGEGAVAEGHAGQEVPRRADQAVVVDAHRHGRGRDAGRSVGARDRARHGSRRRAGESAAQHLQPQALRGAEVRDDDQPHAVGAVGLRQREGLAVDPGRPIARSSRTRWPKSARRRSTGTATPPRSTARTSKAKGMIFVEEKDGLDIEAFRKAVLAQVNKDFPEWTGYIEQIRAVK